MTVLDLTRTQVNDEGLTHLQGLKNLEKLRLLNNRVSTDKIAKLQSELPDCEIRY